MKVRVLKEEDYNKLKSLKLKDIDYLEIHAEDSETPTDLLIEESCRESRKVFGVFIDDKLEGVFGVSDGDCHGKVGIPWLLCSEKVNMRKLRLMREAKAMVGYFKSIYEVLVNIVHKDNLESHKFLKSLGFSFCEGYKKIGKESFIQFYQYREE